MDVSHEHKDKPDGPLEHVIPQMVVTSAEDDGEEVLTTFEDYPVQPISVPTEVPCTENAEKKVAKDSNLPSEAVSLKLTEDGDHVKTESTEVAPHKVDTRSEDSARHSVVQRPLMIETDKCVPQPSVVMETNTQVSSDSPTPSSQTLPPTTMQRPLVFDGSSSQKDDFSLSQEESIKSSSQGLYTTKEDIPPEDSLVADEAYLSEEAHTTVVDSKPKSSGFSWRPTFPKLHASGKEIKALDADSDKKDKETFENQNIQQESSSVRKDGLQNVKKFFDNLLHDTSVDSKEKHKVQSETCNDFDTSDKNVHKDEKQSYYKKIFNLSKADPESEVKVAAPQNELQNESTATPKEHKDSKYNIKKMFDSFKHDVVERKEKPTKDEAGTSQAEIKLVFKETIPSEFQSPSMAVPKEPSNDSKYNVKKMFDSFKHDIMDKKEKSLPDKTCDFKAEIKFDVPKQTVPSEIQTECTSVPKDASKESKYNVKKMFDSLKHDIMDKKESSSKKAFDISQAQEKSDVSKEIVPSEPQTEAAATPKDVPKDSKIKKMFDSFKHDFVDKKDTSSKKESDILECEVKSDGLKTHKDSKLGIKKFFGSLKQDVVNAEVMPSAEVLDTTTITHDDNKENFSDTVTPMKSSKYDGDSIDPYHKEFALPELTVDKSPSGTLVSQNEQCQIKENEKGKPKNASHGVKKFLSSIKQDLSSAPKGDGKKFHVKFMERESSLKRSHSFRDSILIKDSENIEENGKRQKENFHGVKKYFMSSKHSEPLGDIKDSEKRKLNVVKRSQSCRETAAEKEGFHGIKSFFDSFSHRSSSKASSPSPVSQDNQLEEHIYDIVGKPEPSSSDIGTPKSDSKRMSLKGVNVKPKDDHSSMKKLFDSFRNKDQTSKKININDDLEKGEKVPCSSVTSEKSGGEEVVSTENEQKEKDKKNESLVKTSEEIEKTTPKFIVPLEMPKQKPEIIETPSSQINEPSSLPGTKTSVLNTISDNFMAIKDRMLHSKDSKKNEVMSNDTTFAEYDLQSAVNQNDFQPGTSGTYKPIEDVAFISNNLSQEEGSKKDGGSVSDQNNKLVRETPIPPGAIQHSVTPNAKKPLKVGLKSSAGPGTPETLYETCCLRLAVLLGKKAIEIVSDHTKIPPKKPPKPSAEAIAKARAAVVSKRLKEIRNKGQSIGENIPVGYDGIRFADEETESSCDYKDVDHFDYIMDYELINRYKCDSKMDTFSDPSICSGISSYYTADTVTLKDEMFSDAPLETISLDNSDPHLSQQSSLQSKNEIQTWPSSKKRDGRENKTKSTNNKTELNNRGKKAVSETSSQSISEMPTSVKKIPPPIPPKPILGPKSTDFSNKISTSMSDVKGSMSQCINGLSLSPRQQTKFSKDSAATQKRPLLVAGFKGTEFTSLQTKSKDTQGKQLKERTFNTVLKNESLKNLNTISSFTHQPLQSSKSSPPQMVDIQASLSKKHSPQRPPLPSSVLSDTTKLKAKIVAPPVPEKPKRESRIMNAHVQEEKRTVSPPRPPPPVINKISTPPPRPPPPIVKLKIADKFAAYENSEDHSDLTKFSETSTHQCNSSLDDSRKDSISLYHDARESADVDFESMSSDSKYKAGDQAVERQSSFDSVWSEKNVSTPHPATEDNTSKLFENKQLQDQSDLGHAPSNADVPTYTPKPPPRIRRIRSRTVEVVPKEKVSQTNLRRSQSLSDIDIQKRTSSLNVKEPAEKVDLKHLYTAVNKDGKRTVLSGSQSLNLEKVSGRPLPPPPPPPRKFRSLDRKPKEKQSKIDEGHSKLGKSYENVQEAGSSNLFIKPPERRKKTEKERFLSLSVGRREKSESFENSKMPRSNSVPLKPDRKFRHVNTEYDENANVAFPIVAEIHHSAVVLDECGNEIIASAPNSNIPIEDTFDSKKETDSSEKVFPHPRQRKGKNPKKKSHSSWYDETCPVEGSWELLDWDPTSEVHQELGERYSPGGKLPRRRQSDPSGSRIIRQTSKFYVNVEHGEGLPHLDKETSPLPIDCSEKSVQTSLETLSHEVVSRDEQSESSDNTDNLLNIVKTLQSELKITLNRHKSLGDEDNESSNAATDTEKMETIEKKALKTPSIQSSTSDLWPMSSSDESDGEISHSGSVNLSEIALNRKKKKIFYIAQEIMTSEEVFVDTLKLLNVDFKVAVEAASKQRNVVVIPDDVLSQILNHLPQLQHLNENLLMELKDRMDNWDKTEKIADIIVKMGPFLKLYSWFIHDFESNLSLLEESKKKFPLFGQVVKEFEASIRCKRLTLNHYMLKPIQRIPQYRLLLQEYLHHLSEESPDYQDTVTALQIVSEVANHANESMKQGDNAQKLISIQNSIMGHKEIIKPGRLFLKEGVLMKLSRKGMQPRWFVLFNDLLLYLTPVQQGLYRINHELPLTGMKVAIPIQQDYQNEFSIISVTRSFTLAARSQDERQEWIVALTKAIDENASKRSTFTNIRLQQKVQDKNSEDDDSEFILGKKAPVWIPDARVTMCQLCTSEFTVTFRRHHCRACGKVVCSICSGNRIPLQYLGGNKVNRVCDECYSKLGPDASGFPESAETDSDNQQIAVKPHLRTEHRYVKKGKRNLPSVLKEVCANDQGSTISGYLKMRSGKSWKKEWFVVKDKVLYEYKASEDVAALRSIPLLGYQIESFSEAFENVDSSLLFQLTHPGQAPIIFHADSVGSTERWIAALKEASVLEN